MQAYSLGETSMANFDTLQYAKRAMNAGFTKEQAEFQAEEMGKVITDHVATKEDLNQLSKTINENIENFRKEVIQDIATLRTEVQTDIEIIRLEMRSLESRLTLEMRSLENRLTIKMGSMLVVMVGVLTTIIKVF